MAKVIITKIDWDTDGDEALKEALPNTMTLDTEDLNIEDPEDENEISDAISDYLSDEYGFCHNGFEMHKTS